MTITVLSPAAGNSPLGALTGGSTDAAQGEGGFASLLGQLLLAAGQEAGAPGGLPGLFADAQTDSAQAAALAEHAMLLAGTLPERMDARLAALRNEKRATEADAPAPDPLFAALQAATPVRVPPTPSPHTDAATGLAGSVTGPALAAQRAELTLLPNEPANLADPLPTEAGNTPHTSLSAPPASPAPTQFQASALELKSPVHGPNWSQEFGEKIVWMARNEQQHAQLNLNPAHLGPLRITLSMDADTANATFTAATPEVRQVIEDALPRLREMLAQAGIALGQAQVGTQSSPRQHASPGTPQPARSGGEDAILEAAESPSSTLPIRRGNALVDLFA